MRLRACLVAKCCHVSCLAANTTEYDSGSAWETRHETKGPFTGLSIPFGSLIDFLPPITLPQWTAQFSSRAIPGLFLGYHLHPGAIFKGEYYVISLTDYTRVAAMTAIASFVKSLSRHPRREVGTPPRATPPKPKTEDPPVKTFYSCRTTRIRLPSIPMA